MLLSNAFDFRGKLPPVDFVRLLGAQEWLFRVSPLPQHGIKLIFSFAHSHSSSIWWSLADRLAEPCIARLVIFPTDAELVEATGWRIYCDVNGTNPTTMFERPKFPKRTGRFAICNVDHIEPKESANLIEFYPPSTEEVVDCLTLTAKSM
jgi:hypothetical protein